MDTEEAVQMGLAPAEIADDQSASENSPKLQFAIPSEEDPALGDPMKIVENQRGRLDEFAQLTKSALNIRLPECDTDMRTEVEGEMVPVTITLPEQPFDFTRYRTARDEKSRTALRMERQDQLRPHQTEIAAIVERLGGHISQYGYITNALDAEIPVCELDTVAKLKGVLGIELDNGSIISMNTGSLLPSDPVDGIQRRLAFGLPAAGHAIFNGARGTTRNSGTAVRFGVIEANNALNTSHLSFRRGDGTTRIVDTDRCAFWFPSNRCINSATTTLRSHGTLVTSIILSDFSQGQSSSITNSTEQYRRSGVAPRATVHYYSLKTNKGNIFRNAKTAIVEAAFENGVDIINMSFGDPSPSNYCMTPSLSNMREKLEAARDAGVVLVAAAGNSGAQTSYSCTVVPPAAYPTTISVGGTGTAKNLAALETVNRQAQASFGNTSFSISGGRTVTSSMVDFVANHSHHMGAGDGTIGIVSDTGTSFAAPSIAGIVGLIKHWIAYRGGLPQNMASDATAIRALLSLMGDGRSPQADLQTSRSHAFGYGNVRFVNLDSDLGTYGRWGIHRASVSTGSVHEWNIGSAGVESSLLKGFKAVAIADRDNYSDSPDVSFQLIDKCSSSTGVPVMTADRSALQWRLRAWQSRTSLLLHNRCLWLRATTNAAKSPTNLYVAWVLYSNDRSKHDASNQ